ncbi:MAG: ParA family protein, partial [Candidatus Thermoplasmatota archaeon]|nr:ParA family protein [Candidatus Thermoplasmatota archaeon]
MTTSKVRFNDALADSVRFLNFSTEIAHYDPLIVRDVQGRIRIAIDKPKSEVSPSHIELLETELSKLGAFSGGGPLFRNDFFEPDAIFQSPDIVELYDPEQVKPVRVLDRQITGQDWLRPQGVDVEESPHPPRLVFYGLKGGVGRSTALTMLAYDFARSGKRVLLLDLDLESPGLSSLLLPPERLVEFGLVDWFVEDAVGQGEEVLRQMIASSPLSASTQGEIRIAAAMGANEIAYVPKLSRVYADIAKAGSSERFSHRVKRLVEALEAQEKPDVVLIDSRAGLHDLAAVSIVGLSTHTFFFATDTAQSWEGYRLLFTHWQAHPFVLRSVRDRLMMVQALFPEEDQEARADRFLDKAYTLFS